MNEKEFFIFLGNQFKDRIRVRFEKDKGEILDLIIQYEALINGKWAAIVRYDCAHGFFHRDLLHPNGDKEKKAIDQIRINLKLNKIKSTVVQSNVFSKVIGKYDYIFANPPYISKTKINKIQKSS